MELNHLFYFPSCKVIRVEEIPNEQFHLDNYILHLKSNDNTPKHYPQHPILKGKMQTIFIKNKYDTILDGDYGQTQMNSQPYLSKFKNKNCSVIVAFFQEEISQKYELICVALGRENEDCEIFNTQSFGFIDYHHKNKIISMLRLKWMLNSISGKEVKKQKI